MAFIRNKEEERTGYQIGEFPPDSVDNHCDFAMVYRLDPTTLERIKIYKDKGYIVHLMVGISWGRYLDYLEGEWDGREHWDEGQTDRYGNMILHNPKVPYMCPTVSFSNYLSEKLKIAVDAGVEAIHVEEPEFWDRAGYSEAFKREYKTYYREDWVPPHESVDAKYKCSKLKAYLFTRTIDRLSASLKEYAWVKYNRELRFYVPTHSLLNYTQWKIVSPEGKLSDIPCVDGCIAQVWSETAREKTWFDGELKERTFECAYLEYGVMQELVKGTGRKMWFLHDPIGDNPNNDWNDYRRNYLCTVAASLMHPKVNTYEFCPWPNRVFECEYPQGSPNAERIPPEYATLLNNNFNTLGTLELGESDGLRVGVLTGDCQLYQREYPDCEFSEKKEEQVGTVITESVSFVDEVKEKIFNAETPDKETLLKYMQSSAFPGFFSLALPFLKYGLPVRPVLLDNARRYTGYLNDYDVLILSYEFMKPDYPDINNTLAEWVKQGGTLIYVGDGKDPFNDINSWWTGKYKNPSEHLFEMLGIQPKENKEIFKCLKGTVGVLNANPCVFSYSKDNAQTLRDFFLEVIGDKKNMVEFKNNIVVKRDNYIVAAVMDESINDEPIEFNGLFVDMFSPSFDIVEKKTLYPNDKCMLLDLSQIKDELAILGTSVRFYSLENNDNTITADFYGASDFKAYIRLLVPFEIKEAYIDDEKVDFEYDAKSKTVLLSFESFAKHRKLKLK